MKRFLVLLVTITAALLFLQSRVSGEEVKPIFSSPLPNSTLVQAGTTITFRFAEEVEAGSLTDKLFQISGSESGEHAGTALLTQDQSTVIFEPDVPFKPSETVRVRLKPGLRSTTGNRLFVDSYDFTVSASIDREHTAAASLLLANGMGYRPEMKIPSFTKSTSTSSFSILPASFPKMTIDVPANGTAEGYVFISNFSVDWTQRGSVVASEPFLLILDNNAEPVFYREMNKGQPALDFKKQPNGLLTYGLWGSGEFYGLDNSYNIVKTYRAGNGYSIDIHDLQIIPEDHALIMIYDPQVVDMTAYGGLPDATVIGLVLQELDDDGNVVFQWRSWDHFKFEDSIVDLTAPVVDYAHGNSIELDFDGNLLISSRTMDEITKIDRQSGEIIWRLGGKNNEFGSFINDPDSFLRQHDGRRLANGNITIFDNHNVPNSTFARAVEYELDETSDPKTATMVWEYRSSMPSQAMGNAQRLPRNNTMIGWGTLYPSLTEVKPNGDIAFELSFVPPDNPNLIRNSYRAFRFEWEGSPTTIPMLTARNDTPGMTSLVVSWNGATNISAYGAYGGETSDSLVLLKTEQRDGFETEIVIADAEEKLCYFRVMPLDGDSNETRFSNLTMAEHCIDSQAFLPLGAVPTIGD